MCVGDLDAYLISTRINLSAVLGLLLVVLLAIKLRKTS